MTPDAATRPPVAHQPPGDVADSLRLASEQLRTFVSHLAWHATVPSTMELAKDAAEAGAPEGWTAVAEEQTAGRGRFGHSWESPLQAGLYLSIVLRPPVDSDLPQGEPSALRLLTLAAGVAVAESVRRAAGLSVDLKWPNDVLCRGRKLAGLLAEGLALSTPGQAVVLGIGVNLRSHSGYSGEVSARATSIEQEGGCADRGALLVETLASLARMYRGLLNGEFETVIARWRELATASLGSRVEWAGPNGATLTGVALDIARDGALLVETPHGIERFTSASLHWHLPGPQNRSEPV